MVLAPRVVLVHRRTEYAELLARHATRGQAEFFLSSRGRSIDDVKARHDSLQASLSLVSGSLPDDVRQAQVDLFLPAIRTAIEMSFDPPSQPMADGRPSGG